jgi:hypothetical protein
MSEKKIKQLGWEAFVEFAKYDTWALEILAWTRD